MGHRASRLADDGGADEFFQISRGTPPVKIKEDPDDSATDGADPDLTAKYAKMGRMAAIAMADDKEFEREDEAACGVPAAVGDWVTGNPDYDWPADEQITD